ncbi:MAG: HAD hydrolase-like protein [bacterium]|nr:HAD hydrolase-like protein [bacterium]
MPAKAVFLDLFGSLLEDHGVLDQMDRVKFKHGALQALKDFDAAGYKLFVAVCRTGAPVPDPAYVRAIQQRLRKAFAAAHLSPDKVHFISKVEGPTPDVQPLSPERLRALAAEHGLQLSRSVVIGDLIRDVKVGHAVGSKTVLLVSPDDTPSDDDPDWEEPEYLAESLAEAAALILRTGGHSTP